MSVVTQTTFGGGPRIGAPGDLMGGPCDVITGAAAEAMKNGGQFVVESVVTDGKYRLPQLNSLTLTLSGDLTTGNFAGTLRTTTIDGTNSDTAISTAFNSDHDTTISDILDDLNAIDDITATAPDSSGDNRTILIVSAADKTLSSYVDFTASGITITETNASTDTIAGVTRRDAALEQDVNGLATVAAGDDVAVIRAGRVYMDSESALAKTDTIYARHTAGSGTNEERGILRNSAGSGTLALAVGSGFSVFKAAAAADDTAIIELNKTGS